MKRNLLFLLLLVSVGAHAQNFAPVGATWHFDYPYYGRSYHQEYYSEKDTFFEGRQCRKIVHTHVRNGIPVDTLDNVYLSNGTDTVFYYNTVFSRFLPLYIYNVSTGDTVTFHTPDTPENLKDTLIKMRVDTVFDYIRGTDTLKSYWLTELNGQFPLLEYTERIGQYFNFLHFGSNFEMHGDFRCYNDSTLNYISSKCEYLDTSTGSSNSTLNNFAISVYPNPASEILFVETSCEDITYTIYDALGKFVSKGTLGNENTITLSDFSSGIYSIEFRTSHTIQRQRFVISQ